jgi:hypothetical protein
MVEPESGEVPAELLASAHRRPTGELAWRRDDAIEAVQRLSSAGFAVLGGELWILVGGTTVWAGVPADKEHPAGVYTWSTTPGWTRQTESWQEFCARAAAHSLAVLRGEDPNSVDPAAVEARIRSGRAGADADIRYNLTFVNKSEYQDIII